MEIEYLYIFIFISRKCYVPLVEKMLIEYLSILAHVVKNPKGMNGQSFIKSVETISYHQL